MKKRYFKQLYPLRCLLLFCLPLCSLANNNKQKWAVNPFVRKEFVENKGQFASPGLIENNGNAHNRSVLFAVNTDGLTIFFTKNGVIYKHDQVETEKEEGEEEKKIKLTSTYSSMEWLASNEEVEVIGLEKVGHYYTFPGAEGPFSNKGIRANAYRKILYKNLYPGIDVEYSFPENKAGIKYTAIVHPGADVSLLKMKYHDIESIKYDVNSNILIPVTFGSIIDHAPMTFYKEGGSISSSFEIKEKNTVGFKINDYDKSKEMIIDPWTTVTTFTLSTKAYDVNYDSSGNVYIYGGGSTSSAFGNYQLVKMNDLGVTQWIYSTTLSGYYADFAVDENTGTSYIAQAFSGGAGCSVFKVNTLGIQTASNPGTAQFNELWRMSYNNCTKQIVIAGGGVAGSTNQACVLDTSLTTFTPANVLSTNEVYHDMALLTQDNLGNCYMATARSGGNAANFDNILLKLPLPNLLPVTYSVSNGHTFKEVGSVAYYNTSRSNGFNGLAANSLHIYSYDGSVLKKWDALNGVLLNTLTITPTPFRWGGLTVDECDNIFVGVQNSVQQYDGDLNLISTNTFSDTIYDVKMDEKNIVYACGENIVATMNGATIPCVPPTISITSSTCSSGSIGGAIAQVPQNGSYSFLWLPGGETTQSVTGLPPGTYTVVATRSGCNGKTTSGSATVVIPSTSSVNFTEDTISGCVPVCINFTNTSANTSTCAWSFSNGYTSNSCNLSYCFSTPATYGVSLTVKDVNGCVASLSKNNYIDVFPNPTASFTYDPTYPTTLDEINFTDLSAGNIVSWLWDLGSGDTSFVQDPQYTYLGNGIYQVHLTVVDNNQCVDDTIQTIEVKPVYFFYAPNAFSPNNDGLNDTFLPQADIIIPSSYYLTIYDRWGNRIFETKNYKQGWDGKINNSSTVAQEDVYIWKISLSDFDEQPHEYRGMVLIIR